jgi:Flp pilus assembly protein TadG
MITRMRRTLGRFAGDRRGVSAVEFALLALLMIALYFGSVEVSDGVIADRKVTLTAVALANLTAQVPTISTSDMSNILDASSAIITPYSAAKLKITVSCVAIDGHSKAALAVANSQLIFAEASYDYKPTIGYTITGTLTLAGRMYMSPRISAPIYNNIACS